MWAQYTSLPIENQRVTHKHIFDNKVDYITQIVLLLVTNYHVVIKNILAILNVNIVIP